MGTLTICVGSDEVLHNGAPYLGLHCLPIQKQSKWIEI